MKKPEIHILNEGEIFDKNRYKAIFGDFDKDGIDNLDDPNPTKKGDTTTVEERKLVDGMSKLLTIKNNLDITMHHAVKDLAAVAPKDSKIYARTKTPYSIVQKLIEKRLIVPKDLKKGLTDLIGTTIAVDDYADILKMRSLIENGKIYEVYEIEDFYKHPLDGYMAVHYILIYKDDKGTFPVELQLKTKRMKAINEISHGAYAAHNLDKSRLLECTSIANRADKGDENAIAQYNDLMKDKDALKDSFYLNKTKKYKDGGVVNEEWSEINNMYNNGGGLESFTTVEEYFKNLPFDKLPKEFSDYVKTEILTDSDLKHLSQNEPIFVQIKDKIDGYLKPVETTASVAPNKNLALRIKLLKKNLEKDPSNISIKTRIKLLSKNLSK
jgi:ppGpp synthetase/RelA/SpoT-type nucleotidyltranferase